MPTRNQGRRKLGRWASHNEQMRLGLLICDHVRPELRGVSGDYEAMFRRLFARHRQIQIVPYDVIAGDMPTSPGECDAWITTGSRHSVNDDEPWIRDLEAFVRRVARAEVPFVGICFGHQLIAKALGGTVVRAEQGWGVGLKEVEVKGGIGLGGPYRILTSHQDQIAGLPPGGEILGWNDHCPVSLLGVGDHMLGIQGHPEFVTEYSRASLESRRGTVISDDLVDAGLESLSSTPDSARLADWIVAFIERAAAGQPR